MKLLNILLFLLIATSVSAVPGDENWDANWALPGADGEVRAVLEFDGDLIISGDFQYVGDVAAPGVARYDGTAWSSLGAGVPGDVYAATVYDGQLYVGGELFDDSGPLGGLARWNGSTWDYDPYGPLAYVEGLLEFQGDLVAMGNFGDGTVTFGTWDGTGWNDMNAWGDVYATDMTTDGVNLYATGSFEWIGDTYVSHVARWDGSQWFGMGGGLSDEFGESYEAYGQTIHAWGGKVAVSGFFATAGGQALPNFAVWDGAGWGPLGTDATFFSGPEAPWILGDHAGELIVFNGYSWIFAWNGFFWETAGSGGYVISAGSYGGDLILGGWFQAIEGVSAQNVARRSGTGWQAMAGGDGIFGDADTAHVWNDLLVVTGDAQSRFGDNVADALVAAWDGTDWTDLGLGTQSSSVSTIDHMVTYQGDLIVNGNITHAGGIPCNSFARFDGTTWTPLGDAVTNTGGSGMVVLGGELFAIAQVPGKAVASYQSGTDTWLEIGDGPPGTDLYALGTYQGDLVVAGSFPSIDGVAANRIARWDGAAWHPLGAGVEGIVRDLHEADGKLYAAGSITMAGGAPADRIAMWDGAAWSPLGAGLYGSVQAVRMSGGDLYATGSFSLAFGEPAADIARWDGGGWSLLGSGLNGQGLDLTEFGGKLIVVGDFTAAGGHASTGIAGWTLTTSTGVGDQPAVRGGTLLSLSPGRPNPFQNGTTFAFEMPRPGDVRMDVLDVRGRRVAHKVLRGVSAGSRSVSWNGLDHGGHEVSAGTYFVRVRAAGVEARQRVTVVR